MYVFLSDLLLYLVETDLGFCWIEIILVFGLFFCLWVCFDGVQGTFLCALEDDASQIF